MEKVIISSSVRELGNEAFQSCQKLCEVVFEPESQLERIGESCFTSTGLTEFVVPKSVRAIEGGAFCYCQGLAAFSFEEGSQIKKVGNGAFFCAKLDSEDIKYPASLKANNE